MENYLVVLFKNKKRKRIIKKFVTLSRAKSFFNKLMEQSDDVIFEVVIEGYGQVIRIVNKLFLRKGFMSHRCF